MTIWRKTHPRPTKTYKVKCSCGKVIKFKIKRNPTRYEVIE